MQFLSGVILSFVALAGAALMLLPAVGLVSGLWVGMSVLGGIFLTLVAVLVEHSIAGYDFTAKPPHITGIIILTTALTYAILTLLL